MGINRKKLKKNLPYLFIFLAVGAVVAYRSYDQMHPAYVAPVKQTKEQEEYAQHRIANMPYFETIDPHAPVGATAFIDIGTIHRNAHGETVIEKAAPVPPAGPGTIFPVLTFADPLPDNAKAAEIAYDAVEKWRQKGHNIDGVYIRYDVAKPDFKSYEILAQILKRKLGSINLVLQRSWFDDPEAWTHISNIGKYSRIYAFDLREAARPQESIASTIAQLEAHKLSYYLIVDDKPDLITLRSQLNEPTAFMGIAYRHDAVKPSHEENKK